MRSTFPSRPLRGCLTAVAIMALAAAPAAPLLASAGEGTTVVHEDGVQLLSLGATRAINLPAPMTDVVIANPEVLDVHVRSARQLYLIPKAPGQSELSVTNAAGRIIYRTVVRVGANLSSMDQMLRLAMPEADITITTMNNTLLLTGTVAAPEDAAEAERLVGAFAGEKVNIISRLKTATPLTVNLQVRIAEVSKSIGKSLGSSLNTTETRDGFRFNLSSDGTGSLISGGARVFGLNILATLDAAETQGLAATLANPNLTALSGETASFLAGGELPIPLSTGLGAVSVDYKQYGISLSFTPTVLADGRISMRVRPEVSDLDYQGGVTIGGTAVPGIRSRRAETTVELGSGQSFMIGGLLSSTSGNSISKTPLLGDLPVLGNLFKSSNYRRQQTELVIVVTPYLVRPVDARDAKLPTDGFRNANDAQRWLGAQLHDSRNEPRPSPAMAPPITVPAGSVSAAAPAAAIVPGAPRTAKGKAAPGFSF